LENDEWKHDRIPEVFKGQNVYDFIDPEIEEKLAALEAEEEKLEAEGFYESEEDLEDAEEADIRYKAELIREKRQLIRNEAKMRKSLKNRAVVPRSAKAVKMSQMGTHLQSLGFDTTKVAERAQSQHRGRSLARAAGGDGDAMDLDSNPKEALLARSKSRGRSQSTNRRNDGVTDEAAAKKAERVAKLSQRKMNRAARQGEGDRHQTGSLIKHLVSRAPTFRLGRNTNIECRRQESVVSERRTADKRKFGTISVQLLIAWCCRQKNHEWRLRCIRYQIAVCHVSRQSKSHFSLVERCASRSLSA
jgi:nucleolar GTP-binding protein